MNTISTPRWRRGAASPLLTAMNGVPDESTDTPPPAEHNDFQGYLIIHLSGGARRHPPPPVLPGRAHSLPDHLSDANTIMTELRANTDLQSMIGTRKTKKVAPVPR